jgi:hypothetical protein
MTEPRDGAPDPSGPTEPVDAAAPVADAETEAAAEDREAARAEAEAAALAANEVEDDDELPVGGMEDDLDDAEGDDLAAADAGLDADMDGPAGELAADDEIDGDEEAPDQQAADQEAADEAADEADADAAVAVGGASGVAASQRRSGRAAREARDRAAAGSTAVPIDPSIRVRDRASTWFVLGTVLVFVVIFLNGMLLGTGGLFRPYVSPSPEPSALESAAPSESVTPSVSVGPTGSPATSSSPATSAPPASVSPGPS